MTTSSPNQYKIEASTAQHLGDREEQQDRVALFAAPKARGYMMAVLADGMGGKSGGAIAAEQVIRTAEQNFERFSPLTDTVEAMLQTIVHEADTLIKLNQISSKKEPHSTIVILVLTPEKKAIWTHIGDSRLYHFIGPNCAERTTDHSYAEKLMSEGKLTYAQAKDHPMSNVLINALGMNANEVGVPIEQRDNLKTGDAFLLCSDGLWRYFSEDELGPTIATHTPRQAGELLIKNARQRAIGTPADNCSIAIIKLVPLPVETKNYTVRNLS